MKLIYTLISIAVISLCCFSSCQKIEKGNAVFFVSEEHSCGEIEVTIGDVSGHIITSHPYIDCSYLDALRFQLVEGTYKYTAKNNCQTWEGALTVRSESCHFEELVEE